MGKVRQQHQETISNCEFEKKKRDDDGVVGEVRVHRLRI